MVAMWWLGERAMVIIPYNAKYKLVKYMKKMNQRNFEAVHSNPIMEYTIAPYSIVWTNM